MNACKIQGLPEYRNGGLFVDLGVLTPKQALLDAAENASELKAGSSSTAPSSAAAVQGEDASRAHAATVPRLAPTHPAVVEWRAMTVCLLDRVHAGLNAKFGLTGTPAELNLKQVLEAA